jgi:hypothetical protein
MLRNDVVRFEYSGKMRVGRVDGIQAQAVNGSRNVVTVQLSFDKDGPVPLGEKRFKSFDGSRMGSVHVL